LAAQVFAADLLLAEIRCWLGPPNAPLVGLAIVPDGPDWLGFGTLDLLLSSGQHYWVTPTAVEPDQAGTWLLKFKVEA
jgi:hypothetical protein